MHLNNFGVNHQKFKINKLSTYFRNRQTSNFITPQIPILNIEFEILN